MRSRIKPACLIAAVLIGTFGMAWQAATAVDDKTSCQKFVQSFYDWYIAKCNGPDKKSSAVEIALKTRSEVFSPELCKQLKEDLAASAKSPGEIVGLDFDPVLNSQDEAEHYKAEKVTGKGKSYLVDVYSISGGKREPQPAVQPELIQSNGKWQFVNFHYNVDKKSDDLLHILKDLRDERKKYKKG